MEGRGRVVKNGEDMEPECEEEDPATGGRKIYLENIIRSGTTKRTESK